MRFFMHIFLLLFTTVFIAGCGTTVPHIGEFWERDYLGDPGDSAHGVDPTPPITASGQIEYEVKQHVYCELRHAVEAADYYFVKHNMGGPPTRNKLLPDEWGAQMSLSLQADENTTLNTSLSFNTPYSSAITNIVGKNFVTTPQSRTVGFGATLSSTSSRADKFNSYFTIDYLRTRSHDTIWQICEDPKLDPFLNLPGGSVEPAKTSFLTGELGIKEWLIDSLVVNRSIPSYGTSSGPVPLVRGIHSRVTYVEHNGRIELQRSNPLLAKKDKSSDDPKGQDTISIEIKFIVVSSGNVNPTWKLVRISADAGSIPLVAAGRTRTHDLVLTIGPRSTQSDFANLALQIGQAVSSGNRAALVSP